MIVRKGDTKKLKSFKNVYRLRVGNFRVIYSILNEIVLIIRIIDRKNLKKFIR
jgi:mRNA-degrading endonuclease RelE of RelBE toxin-antitoxin system